MPVPIPPVLPVQVMSPNGQFEIRQNKKAAVTMTLTFPAVMSGAGPVVGGIRSCGHAWCWKTKYRKTMFLDRLHILTRRMYLPYRPGVKYVLCLL